jgi:D-Tyr-tRNAtyr deacylase
MMLILHICRAVLLFRGNPWRWRLQCTACTLLLQAREFYGKFVERVGREYSQDKVKDGVFGAMMAVNLVNDVRPFSLHIT